MQSLRIGYVKETFRRQNVLEEQVQDLKEQLQAARNTINSTQRLP